jgi:hypothetical protein
VLHLREPDERLPPVQPVPRRRREPETGKARSDEGAMNPSRLTTADLLATLAERVDDLSLQGNWPEWSATIRARAARIRSAIAYHNAEHVNPRNSAAIRRDHDASAMVLATLNAPDEEPTPSPTPGPTRSTQRANRELQATDDRDVYDGGTPGPAKS